MGGERSISRYSNLWLIAAAAIIAPFMEVLDTSIANVALPYIAGNLSASLDEAVWVLTSYLVANAAVLPASAWFSARMGRKQFYLLSVLLFTVSSFFCGIAPSLSVLIFFRVLQGLGGGGLQPTTQAILADLFPKERIASAFTLYSIVIVLAPTLGPVLGGWLSDNWGWRWIFFLNIPCGLAAYLLNRALQPATPRIEVSAPIDYPGLLGTALGLGCLEYVLDRGERADWFASPTITVAAIVSCGALVWLVFHELYRTKHPVLQLRLFANRNFALACGMIFFTYFARYASTALLPEFTHGMLAYTATSSGLVLSPGSLALLLLLPGTTWLMKRVDDRLLIMSGLLVTALAFYLLASSLSLQVDYGTIVKLRILESSGVALFLTPLSVLAFSRLKSGKNDAAASLYGLFRNLGSAIGISVGNTILVRGVQTHRTYIVQTLSGPSSALHTLLQTRADYFRFYAGSASGDAMVRALASVQMEVDRQATLLCYVDCFRLLLYISVALSPVAFFFEPRILRYGADKRPAIK